MSTPSDAIKLEAEPRTSIPAIGDTRFLESKSQNLFYNLIYQCGGQTLRRPVFSSEFGVYARSIVDADGDIVDADQGEGASADFV